jgi:predicted dienelactone hydrolase
MFQRMFAVVALVVVLTCGSSFAANHLELAVQGPFEIGFTSFVLTDSSRPGDGDAFLNRPIPVYVWYPVDPESIDSSTPEAVYPLDPLYVTSLAATSGNWEAYGMDPAYQEPDPSSAGPFPLLMFSPGWGAPAWMHTSIGTRLASHGFVVAIVYHFGDQWWPWEPPYDNLALASWNRPRDVSFTLTELLNRNAMPGNLLHELLMPDAVAAGGWSLGGYASMVLAAGDDSVCDKFYEPGMEWTLPLPDGLCGPSPPDPRIKAIVPLDGSNQLLYFEELARVRIPAMGIGEEWGYLELTDPEFASWQARQHAAFSGHPRYRVDVFNTNHQSFSDTCEGVRVLGDLGLLSADDVAGLLALFCDGMTPSAEVHTLVNQYLIAFLKAHLRGQNRYQRLLTPGYALTRQPLIEFFVNEKRSPNSIDDDWPDDFIYFMHQPGSETAHAAKNPHGVLNVSRILEPQR